MNKVGIDEDGWFIEGEEDATEEEAQAVIKLLEGTT